MKFTNTLFTIGLVLALAACAPASSPKNEDPNSGTASGHDGTESLPKALTLGTSTPGKIGSYDNVSNSESYYSFNTGSNTDVLLSISNSSVPHPSSDDFDDYTVQLFDGNDGFDGSIEDSATIIDDVAPVLSGLTNDHVYYLRILNRVSAATTYNIKVEALPAEGTLNQGSVSLPVTLTLGTEHSAFTTDAGTQAKSYYKFNTGTSNSVTISYSKDQVYAELFRQSTFTGLEAFELTSDNSLTASDLTAGTDYYLVLENDSLDHARVEFTLTVSAN